MIDFFALALTCSPNVAVETISAIVEIESSYNPYAIGVVGGYLERQPKSKDEAIDTANMLYEHNYNFSMGLAQINLHNLSRYNISIEDAFDPCTNLKIGGKILEECYLRAVKIAKEQDALRKAFSCYYSGNFIRGFKPDNPNTLSYVDKVVNIALMNRPVVPKVKVTNDQDEIEPISIKVVNTNGTPPKNTDRDKPKKNHSPSKIIYDNDSIIINNDSSSYNSNDTQVF